MPYTQINKKHTIVTSVCLLCMYFDQIIPLLFCHQDYSDKGEQVVVRVPFGRLSIKRTLP